jgi:hypothetical protein
VASDHTCAVTAANGLNASKHCIITLKNTMARQLLFAVNVVNAF